MLVEIRHYTIKPGRRTEFVEWFEAEVVPAMEACGIRIIGIFEGVEDPDAFYYLRCFESEDERVRLTGAFYESEQWLGGMRDKALALERDFEVTLVQSTTGSRL